MESITTEQQYEDALRWLAEQFNQNIASESPIGQQIQLVLLHVGAYEDIHYPIPLPSPDGQL